MSRGGARKVTRRGHNVPMLNFEFLVMERHDLVVDKDPLTYMLFEFDLGY